MEQKRDRFHHRFIAEIQRFSPPQIETLSAGLSQDAVTPLSADLIEWADVIVVMEKAHKSKLNNKFRACLAHKKVVVLGIPDKYAYMQPELVALLKARVPKYVRLPEVTSES